MLFILFTMDTWAIILSVLIPLLLFMWALLPWIRRIVRADTAELSERVANIEGQLKVLLEQNKSYIDLLMKLEKIGNPDDEKGILLLKLRNDTITRDEAIKLEQIMNAEREVAESENNFLKGILIIGILSLIAIALSRTSR